MDDQTVRMMLDRHWAASDSGDFEVEHEIYSDDAVLDYPQSGERIRGRRNIQHAGGNKSCKEFLSGHRPPEPRTRFSRGGIGLVNTRIAAAKGRLSL